MTNGSVEPRPEGQGLGASPPSRSEAPSVEAMAFTFAFDLCGDESRAIAFARDLLKDIRKSGLKPPFAQALLRRLALAEWTRLDRPRPARIESNNPKESASLLFFLSAWGVGYEDIGLALGTSEDRARHLVHKGRIEQIATLARLPIPRAQCRRPRELLSDYRESLLAAPLAEDVTAHLRECRECSVVDFHLQALLQAPARPLIEPPIEIVGVRSTRPSLSFSLDGISLAQRRAGIVLLAVGLILGAVQFHPGLNAAAAARMDRMGATWSRWRSRGERALEDLRVLRALAIGTMEGRTEELTQTLDEYVNPVPASENEAEKNKAAPDAVLNSRDPDAKPTNQGSEKPANGSQRPENP